MARASVRVEAGRHFAVSLEDGFAYITDPAHWPEYWPRLVRIEPGARWREPGDRARLVLRMLARDVTLDMTLVRIDRHRLVEYTSRQRGLPPAHHRRHFDRAGEGFDYRIVVEYEPRPGVRRGFDRVVVKRATRRMVDETFDNLARTFSAAGSGP